MFDGIKRKMGLKQMRKEFRNVKRTARVSNLSDAQSVAIIYRADDEEKAELVKKYVKHLKEEEGIRKIMAFGYHDNKEMPEYLKPKLEFDFICNKDLAWNYRPTSRSAQNFSAETWDILIDLESEEITPLRYILNWSKARFKVGFYNEEFKQYYDLMIDVKSKDIVDYIAQVSYYLSIINKVS